MNKTTELKNYYIKMIHTLKHNYFIDDECRKIYLKSVYNKESLTELSINELREVLTVCGYKPYKKYTPSYKKAKISKDKSQTKANAKAAGINDTAPIKDSLYATKRQLETIAGIWDEIARNKSPMALREFIFRIVKIRPLHLKSLSRDDARDVVQALIQMKEKHASRDNQ